MVIVVETRRRRRPLVTGLIVGGAVAGAQQRKMQQRQQQAEIQKANMMAEEAMREAEKAKLEAAEAKQEAERAEKDIVQVSITVPAGMAPGQSFFVEYEGQAYNIVCPPGVSAGQKLNINIPARKQVVLVSQPNINNVADVPIAQEAVQLELSCDHLVDENSPSIKQFSILSLRKGEQVTLVEGDLTNGLGGGFKDYIRVDHAGRIGLISRHVVQPTCNVPLEEFTPPPAIMSSSN